MLFLIEYERKTGRILNLKTFLDEEREHANDLRFTLESEQVLCDKNDVEIALLEAENFGALLITHARYFLTVEQIVNKILDII
jgi:hypothetical protein